MLWADSGGGPGSSVKASEGAGTGSGVGASTGMGAGLVIGDGAEAESVEADAGSAGGVGDIGSIGSKGVSMIGNACKGSSIAGGTSGIMANQWRNRGA